MSASTAPALAIASAGIACCVGNSALAACAAIRAHIAGFEEVPFRSAGGAPIVAAPAHAVVKGRQGYHRLGPLLVAAVADCIGGDLRRQAHVLRTVPCIIVTDHADRPDHPHRLGDQLLAELRDSFGGSLHSMTQVVRGGATGFFEVLMRARAALTAGSACIVVAVDSLINRTMLATLEQAGRLLTDDNSDGVVPGEAAAALWLVSGKSDQETLACIDGIGLAREPSAVDAAQPNKGLGLAQAMSMALADSTVPLERVDFRVAGLTGCRREFAEASTALARIQKVHKDDFVLWSPAEQIGDVGASLPACMIVAAAMGISKRYAPGPRGIVYSISDRDRRAACTLAGRKG